MKEVIMMSNRTGKYVLCDYCKKEFYVTQTRLKRSKTLTCSVECASNLKKEMFNETRKCEWCDNEFITKKGKSKRFCGIECQHEWQKNNTGHKNPKFQGKTILCDYCGKDFEIHKYNLNKYKHHFCSIKCRQEWHKNIFSQDEEWKEKSRIRGAESIKHMSLDTKPQRLINDLLDDMNINYTNEYNVKYYSVDNHLTDYNLMIEIMGDYWHFNPCKYKCNPNEFQCKSMRKDNAKHTYLKKYYNIEILYLWETDVYKNIELCKSLIEEYINNEGLIENYHSFNYYLNNGKPCLKDDIVELYTNNTNPVTTTA